MKDYESLAQSITTGVRLTTGFLNSTTLSPFIHYVIFFTVPRLATNISPPRSWETHPLKFILANSNLLQQNHSCTVFSFCNTRCHTKTPRCLVFTPRPRCTNHHLWKVFCLHPTFCASQLFTGTTRNSCNSYSCSLWVLHDTLLLCVSFTRPNLRVHVHLLGCPHAPVGSLFIPHIHGVT